MDQDVVSRLVFSMVQFLRTQLENAGASSVVLTEEGAESVEVALQCLETAYGITPESSQLAVSRSLYDIFHDAIREEVYQGSAANLGSSPPLAKDKEEAECLKNEGNLLMRDEKFDLALDCYTKAIAKDRTNAVYYCNRAAAHNKLNNHMEAIEDCKRALRIEPQYGKAYGRMGLAYSALENAQQARDCYQKALELEPENESYRGNLLIAEEKLKVQNQHSSSNASNPFAALGGSGGFNLGALGNLAGLAAGGGPGGPDLQGLFNNPALMNMATQLMSDPNMQNMMTSFLGNVGVPGSAVPPGNGGVPPPNIPTEVSGSSSGGSGMEALLTAGRQLAEQMQAQHPDLVEQLRTQMNNRSGSSQGENGGPGNQDPPEPPQT